SKMDRYCTNRIVNSQVFQQVCGQHNHQTAAETNEECTDRVNPITGRGNGDQTAEETIDGCPNIPFLGLYISVKKCKQTSRTSSERCIEGDASNALHIHGRECAARVETVPT